MATTWPSAKNAGEDVSIAEWNALVSALRSWPTAPAEPVNANSQALSNLGTLTFGAGGYVQDSLYLYGSAAADLKLQYGGNNLWWISANQAGILKIGGQGGTRPAMGAINIDASGNVGIGAASPDYKLVVTSGYGGGVIRIGAQEDWLARIKSGTHLRIETVADCSIIFGDTTRDVMRLVTSTGNVGIGTPNPVYQAQVYGTGQLVAAPTDAGDKTAALFIASSAGAPGSGGALLLGGISVSGVLPQAAIKTYMTNTAGNGVADLVFSLRNGINDPALTERLRLTSNGFATFTGYPRVDHGNNKYTVLGVSAVTAAMGTTYGGMWYETSDDVLHIGALSQGVAWRNIALASLGGNVDIGLSADYAARLAVNMDSTRVYLRRAGGNGWGLRVDANGTLSFSYEDDSGGSVGATSLTVSYDGYFRFPVKPIQVDNAVLDSSSGQVWCDEASKTAYLKYKDSGGVVHNIALGTW